jgi:transcriptional regulator with GAF, ATPase, and Fis domain
VSWDRIKYASRAMGDVVARAMKIAATDRPVLLLGERGTGKSLLAEVVHEGGSRAGRPLVIVNCATLTPSLAEAELFGHERGAFTGASSRAKGYFEQADSGTLFLDEVGELPVEVQAHLLSVVERKRIRRVGAEAERPVNVRLISATNRDVSGGGFRADLLDRLGVLKLVVPPLRERPEDIAAISQALYAEILSEQTLPLSVTYPTELPTVVLERLQGEQWPGNVRQLRSALIHLVTFNADGAFGEEDVEFAVSQVTSVSSAPRAGRSALPPGLTLPQYLEQVRLDCIDEALNTTNGDLAKAAKLLGVSRQNLHQVLRRHGRR